MTTQEQEKVWKAHYPAPPMRSKLIAGILLLCFAGGALLAWMRTEDRTPENAPNITTTPESKPALTSPVSTPAPATPPIAERPKSAPPVMAINSGPPNIPPVFPVVPLESKKYPLGYNYALAANGGTITGGSRNTLVLDGNFKNYDGSEGYGFTNWNKNPPEAFVITLKDTVKIDCIRFLLWDKDDRYYRYKLEVSSDASGNTWTMAADCTGPTQQCKSWQKVLIPPQLIKQIRLTGTFNSANSVFHVVELQASLGMPPEIQPHLDPTLEF